MPKNTNSNTSVTIAPPARAEAMFNIEGDAPLVINCFSTRQITDMREKQKEGGTAQARKVRKPKDFDALFEEARHRSVEGWDGFPAMGLQQAMIAGCRSTDLKMVRAKVAFSVKPDGFNRESGVGLVRIRGVKPIACEHNVRLPTGVADIRARAMYLPGWKAQVHLVFDKNLLRLEDVANLLQYGGLAGLCEGRPNSKNSAGMGWGTFLIKGT